MLEAVLGLGPPAALPDQVQPLEVVQRLPNALPGPDGPLQQGKTELAAQDRGGHQQTMTGRREPVDASEDDVLHGPRDLQGNGVIEPPSVSLPDQRARVDQRTHQLLQVERVALGVAQDPRFDLGWQRVRSDQGGQQFAFGLAGECFQGKLGGQMGKQPGRRLLDPPEGMVAFGPASEDQEDGRLLRHAQQPFAQLDGGGVGPVEVLQHRDHRPLLPQPFEQRLHHFERSVLEGLRRQVGDPRRGVGFQRKPQHRGEIRIHAKRGIGEQRFDPASQRHPDAQVGLIE